MLKVNDSKNETITRSITDDNGSVVATFSMSKNSENPMGNYNAWVQNKTVYAENKEQIDELYSRFKEEY